MKITIAGAGIGGLTAARALALDGHEVRVCERSPGISEVGAGIQISPNGYSVIRALGLSDALDAVSLMESLEAGHFYASTGVELTEIAVLPRTLELHIAQDRDFKYETTFIGASGEVLLETGENPAIFQLSEDVGYVRARVRNSRSDYAWTQPIFITRR